MSVTVNVNGLSLVHKGSSGVSMATMPDVCKTPPNSLPVPYPNIAFSSNLANGTRTVTADGGNMCANYGSEFSSSTGDEAGRLGGVVSGTVAKEATWITYSFDVKLEGTGACRLTDKMFHNHQNTVNMGGELQGVILSNTGELVELKILCTLMCEVKDIPGRKQDLIAAALWKMDDELKGRSTMKAEVPMNMADWMGAEPGSPPDPITKYFSNDEEWRATRFYGRIPAGESRRPDVLITTPEPIKTAELRKAVEMKFDDADTAHSKEQEADFKKMFGDKYVRMEEGEDCICDDDPKRRKKRPATEEREEYVKHLVAVAEERKRQLVPPAPSLLDKLMPSPGTLVVGGALIAVGAAAIFFGPELAAGAGIATLFSWATQ